MSQGILRTPYPMGYQSLVVRPSEMRWWHQALAMVTQEPETTKHTMPQTASISTPATPPDAAFSRFLVARQDQLLGIAYRILHDRTDAFDVLQEVACILYKHWHTLDSEHNVDGWLYRVTVNECHRWLRKRAKHAHVDVEEDAIETYHSEAPQQEAHIRTQQFQRFLSEAMALLSEQERLAFVLRDIEQRPGKELATLMGCQPATARGYYFSARKKLAAHIKECAPEWLSLLGGSSR